MAAMIEKKCERCREPIRVRVADHKRGWGRYCSKSCKAVAQDRHYAQRGDYHSEGMEAIEAGWDGHKNVGP